MDICLEFAQTMGWVYPGFTFSKAKEASNGCVHVDTQCPNAAWTNNPTRQYNVHQVLVSRDSITFCNVCWGQPFTGHTSEAERIVTEKILYALCIAEAQLERAHKYPFSRIESAGLVRELLGSLQDTSCSNPKLMQQLAMCKTQIIATWKKIKHLPNPVDDWEADTSTPRWLKDYASELQNSSGSVWLKTKTFYDVSGPLILGASDFIPQFPVCISTGENLARVPIEYLSRARADISHLYGFDQGHTPEAMAYIIKRGPINADEFAQLTKAWNATFV